jgi:hypothetical protein
VTVTGTWPVPVMTVGHGVHQTMGESCARAVKPTLGVGVVTDCELKADWDVEKICRGCEAWAEPADHCWVQTLQKRADRARLNDC